MAVPTHKVIVIDDDPVPSQPKKQVEVIVIGSENTDAATSPPRPTTPYTDTPPKTTRFSDLFEEFRAKWGKQESPKNNIRLSSLVDPQHPQDPQDAQDAGTIDPQPDKMPVKRKKGPAKNKEPRVKKPKTKLEALRAVELVIDDRLTVNTLAFPENIKVTRERLPFHYNAVLWRDGVSGDLKELIVLVLEMSDELVSEYASILEHILEETKVYSKRIILLANYKQYTLEHEKRLQKSFTKAVKDNRRFSGSAAVDLPHWHHQLTLHCLRRAVRLFTVGTHGALSHTLEPFLLEWSKSLAWNSLGLEISGKPVRCGKDDADTFRKMLECIPRMSATSVDAIVRRYGTVRALIEGVREGDEVGRMAVSEQRTVGVVMGEKLKRLFTSGDLSAKLL